MERAFEGGEFEGGEGGFVSLVAHFEAGAVDGLLQVFAGEDAEADGDAGGERNLSDAAGDFVDDDIVVGGVSAQEAADGDQGVVLAGFGQHFGGRGKLEGSGDADDFDVGGGGSGAAQSVGGAGEQTLGDEGVEARDDDGELHPGGVELRFAGRLAPVFVVAENGEIAEAGGDLQDEETRSPVVVGDVGDEGEALGAGGLGEDVGVIDLDDEVGGGHVLPHGELDAGLEGLELFALGAAASPALAGGEAEGREKLLERGVIGVGGGQHEAMERTDHIFFCITGGGWRLMGEGWAVSQLPDGPRSRGNLNGWTIYVTTWSTGPCGSNWYLPDRKKGKPAQADGVSLLIDRSRHP